MAKKEKEKEVLLESNEAIQDKLVLAENWLESNPKIVFGVLGALVLVVGGFFGYRYYTETQNTAAQKEMFQAVRYFEADSLKLASDGDGNNLGFKQIIAEYGMTKSASLANYYMGAIYLKQGAFKAAILSLEDFSSSDLLVQARAYCLIGDANMELTEYDKAAAAYSKAAAHKPNKFFSPLYLMKAALAYEKLNNNEKAKAAYQEIIDKYWASAEYQNARKYKARLETNS